MAIQIDKIQAPISLVKNLPSKSTSASIKYVPAPYLKVARGMEKQYVKFMIDQMNKTAKSSDSNSNGQNYYKSLLDDQRISSMVNNKTGLGLQQVILSQIYPKKFRNKFAYTQFVNSQKNKRFKKVSPFGPVRPIKMRNNVSIKNHTVNMGEE